MRDPAAYKGREQTWLKHRVLEEYLAAWAQKLGSVSRQREVRLWSVDCFSGPWQSADDDLKDTSISIGLDELRAAAETWAQKGHGLKLGAIFVEKDKKAFAALERFVADHKAGVDVFTYRGEFGDHVATIQKHIGGEDSAFLFVDPTGWKGAAMDFIKPLARLPRRDVLVNVMFHHINRFKDDPRRFLREQMRDFFGLGESELTPDLSEDQLMSLYRDRLKSVCGVKYAADLVIPQPTKEQTKFRLVIGGHHPAVVKLFRDVERRVVGGEAAAVRSAAKDRQSGQEGAGLLFGSTAPLEDRRYQELRDQGIRELRAELPRHLAARPLRYGDLWPRVLEACHLTESDLKGLLWDMRNAGKIVIEGLRAKERSLKDNHVVRLALASATVERRCPRCGADAETVEVELPSGRREQFCERCRPR